MAAAGMGGFKDPKLSEAYQFMFGEELVGAHDAFVDTEACARVYFWLLDNGYVEEKE
jgi:DNA polymerase-3 subunit epsilon